MRMLAIIFSLCGVMPVFGQVDPDFETVLQTYLKKETTSVDATDFTRIVADWPGSRTLAGVRSIVEELLKPTGGERRSRSAAILKKVAVPREQIVTYLLESALADGPGSERLWRHFYLFNMYPEDDRILKFLSPMLDDKALAVTSSIDKGRGERSALQPARICDLAHAAILFNLYERGEIKTGDPGFGNPGGEPYIVNRDKNIAELKPLLMRAGYLPIAAQQSTPAVSNVPNAAPMTTGLSDRQNVDRNPINVAASQPEAPGRQGSPVAWMCGVAGVGIIVFVTMRRRLKGIIRFRSR